MQGNFTAEIVTYARAVGSLYNDRAVRNADYLSRELLNTGFRFALRGGIPNIMKVFYNIVTPGIYLYLHLRTRHIDSILEAEIRQGIDQLILVGAGLDSRAYRYRNKLKNVRVFEIDHPKTAALKTERLRCWGGDTSHVTFVNVDLVNESLHRRLSESGFDFSARTFILCEGLLYYLPQNAVVRILEFAVSTGVGSSLVFDYVLKGVVENRISAYGAQKLFRYVARKKEPIKFTLEPNEVADLLQPYGLHVVSNSEATALTDKYLRRSNGKLLGKICGAYGLAQARRG
ncbi:MAG: class I SAM-dependent methyltransferase [Sulfuricaulis sp.]